MPSYTPVQISTILKCENNIVVNDEVKYILNDSRRVIHAKNSLFFAIKGFNHDGHNYINDLYRIGVRNFVVQYIPDMSLKTTANFYCVNDVVGALHDLVGYHRNKFNYPVIGITGSNGKTIIKEWLFQSLSPKYNIVRNPRSYNSQIGVPLSIWNMEENNTLGIFEAGISLPSEMKKLEKIMKPTIGIFSNIGDAHQENFSSLKEKALEKVLLFSHSEALIYCKDHLYIDLAVNEMINPKKIKCITWSGKNSADLTIQKVNTQEKFSDIGATFLGEKIKIQIPFTDQGSVENAIHILCTLLYLNVDRDQIHETMANLSPVEMRLEQKSAINNCTLINDSYNSDLNALTIAIDYLKQQHQHPKKTVILSDILQSGKNEDELYSEVAGIIRDKDVDNFIGVGTKIGKYKELFGENATFYNDTESFKEAFDPRSFENQSILIKGARTFRFEQIEQLFVVKVHRTVLQINLDAVINNLNFFRSLLNPETKVMAMVKAISYGSGTYEIAHLLRFHNIDYLGVAYVDEGIALRKSGVQSPVMVMNPEINHLEQLIEYGLEPEIYSRKILEAFIQIAKSKNCKSYPCHIKIDSGMHRLGFMEEDISYLISVFKDNPVLNIESVFSHLAASDDPALDSLTKNQLKNFESSVQQLTDGIGYPVTRHILNSSGIIRFPEAQYEMVRLGIGLYGFESHTRMNLRNVFTLKSVISQIKIAKKGDIVGYNPTSKMEKDTKIGIIAIGYADGYNRKLGNGVGKVMVNGKKVPLIGNVCMDMCMVDLTDIEDVKEGAEVVIFGDGYTAAQLAVQLNTIPYEIITNISERINRIYFKE